jgi:hypothetical protein
MWRTVLCPPWAAGAINSIPGTAVSRRLPLPAAGQRWAGSQGATDRPMLIAAVTVLRSTRLDWIRPAHPEGTVAVCQQLAPCISAFSWRQSASKRPHTPTPIISADDHRALLYGYGIMLAPDQQRVRRDTCSPSDRQPAVCWNNGTVK